MKSVFLLCFNLVLISAFAQPKGANTISVKGVMFKEAANKLLDHGYIIDKIDSNFQTITTIQKPEGFILSLRIKDSSLLVRGIYQLETVGYKGAYPASVMFPLVKYFALSFNKPVEYLEQ